MKRLLLLFLLLPVMICWAQTPRDEALQSLDSAKSLVAKEDYAKATDEIQYALSKISEIQAERLVKFLPAALPGFTESDRNSSAPNAAMMGTAISAHASYSKGDETSVNITIAMGGVYGQMGALAAMSQMYGGGQPGAKTVRIQGYTGNLQYDDSDKSGTLTIQVGSKISVTIEGSSLTGSADLTSWADKIALGDLEKGF
jgi:hypothetical protein